MDDKVNLTAVGAFVIVLAAVLIAAVLWLASGLGANRPTDTYASIINESVAGLNIDAPVKYLGVDVGKVRTIAIDPTNSRQVRLGLQIDRGTPVKQDSEAVLKTQGLTGIAYVELSGGSVGSPPLLPTDAVPVPIIRSRPSISARLENVLTTVLASIDRLSGSLNAVFDVDNRAALRQTLADVALLSHTLAAQREVIASGLADAAHTAHQTAKASERLDPLIDQINGSLASLQQTTRAATDASERAGRVADEAASAVRTAAGGVQQLRAETLPELAQLIVETEALAVALRRLSEQARRDPNALIAGPAARRPGPGEEPAR